MERRQAGDSSAARGFRLRTALAGAWLCIACTAAPPPVSGGGGRTHPRGGGTGGSSGEPTGDGGLDAGDDAGPGASVCGDRNFDVSCGGDAGACPPNSGCVVLGGQPTCACADGFVALDCAGTPCLLLDGGCASPNWWCAPRVPGPCGAQNFTVPCGADAGSYDCATNEFCGPGVTCVCPEGMLALTCDGRDCSLVDGGCSYPGYDCEPRGPGPCGPLNFSIECQQPDGGIYFCPSHGACYPPSSCVCADGTQPVSCGGLTCNGNCTYPDWWCH